MKDFISNAMYTFQEHEIICCELFNISNVFQVSVLIAKIVWRKQ